MNALILKRGSNLSLSCVLEGQDLTAVTIRMHVRDAKGTLISTIDIAKDPDQVTNRGKYTATKTPGAVDGTLTWPVAQLLADIEYTIGGEVDHTETFAIVVERAQTHS